jgi:hypothetical protein
MPHHAAEEDEFCVLTRRVGAKWRTSYEQWSTAEIGADRGNGGAEENPDAWRAVR